MIAALYVATGGSYYGLANVHPWDQDRDARTYDGPWPVVAHPPCQRWGKMWFGSPNVVKQTGVRKIKGDDEGRFAAALESVRKWGGVLEHPKGSHAWEHFAIKKPSMHGGWIKADDFGGWTCCVEQGRYGHYARKPTWLYACGIDPMDLPELDWGVSEPKYDPELVARIGLKRAKKLGEVCSKGGGIDSAPRIGTPQKFRDLLIGMAQSVKVYDL